MIQYRICGYRPAGTVSYTYIIESKKGEDSGWRPTTLCFVNLDDAKGKVKELKEYPEDKVYIYV